MRRANGSGTVVKLSGNRRRPFAVRVPDRDERGHVVQRVLGYYARSADALAALDEYNTQRKAGAFITPDKLSMTVGEVYALWSARKYAHANPASIASYSAAWNKRLSRYAGRKMRDMTLDAWQAILDEDASKGASQSLINNDTVLIKALNSFAMERDIISKDYSAFLDIPHAGAKMEKGAFDDLTMKKLEKLAADGFPWADTVLMLCYTGFRISEFLALTRFSYHPDGPYLQGGTKTEAGKNRIVPVHPKIQPYLNLWLKREGRTIICSEDGSPVPVMQYRSEFFHPVAEALGFPQATPHWCRHTFATRSKICGVDELARKRILGHADKTTTDHYTHNDVAWLVNELAKIS